MVDRDDHVVRCLFVDDQPLQLDSTIGNLGLAFDARGYRMEVIGRFEEVEAAVSFIQRDPRDITAIVADILWPRDEARQSTLGFQVFQHARTKRPDVLRVALSEGDRDHKRLEANALEAGAQIFKYHGDDLPGEAGTGWLDLADEMIGWLHPLAQTPEAMLANREQPEKQQEADADTRTRPTRVMIGHGHSHQWRELKDFLEERLHVQYDEYDRVATAGVGRMERLTEMLESCQMAFLVLTAEDELKDGARQARQNVAHEVGLCQGALGVRRAIVLLEEGCEEFSNLEGLGQLRYPGGNIKAVFEEVRRVLEREGVIGQ